MCLTAFTEIPASKYSITMRKPVFGVGINDANYMVYPKIKGKRIRCKFYSTWKNMIKRAYSADFHKRQPSYTDCRIHPNWFRFSVFKKWMETQDWKGMDLDKDLLFPGNKIYSPKTCVFVPRSINNLLIGNNLNKGSHAQGVCVDKRTGVFMAQCYVSGTNNHIGNFRTEEDASLAYKIFKSTALLKIAKTQPKKIELALINYANMLLGDNS